MDREPLRTAGLGLVGLATVVIALQDGLTLHEPVARLATRADTVWVAAGAALVVVLGLPWGRRYSRRSNASGTATDAAAGQSRSTGGAVTPDTVLPVALAVGAFVSIIVGVHAEAIAETTVHTGWDGPLNYQEMEMVELAALGVLGALAAVRWRRAAYATLAAGGLVLIYPARFLVRRIPDLRNGIAMPDGTAIEIAFGAEPYLLLVGALLLLVAGLVGLLGPRLPGLRDGESADSASAA